MLGFSEPASLEGKDLRVWMGIGPNSNFNNNNDNKNSNSNSNSSSNNNNNNSIGHIMDVEGFLSHNPPRRLGVLVYDNQAARVPGQQPCGL